MRPLSAPDDVALAFRCEMRFAPNEKQFLANILFLKLSVFTNRLTLRANDETRSGTGFKFSGQPVLITLRYLAGRSGAQRRGSVFLWQNLSTVYRQQTKHYPL